MPFVAKLDVPPPMPLGVPWEAPVVESPAGVVHDPEGAVQYSKVTVATMPVVAVVKLKEWSVLA